MISNGREFPDKLENVSVYWEIRNEPGNTITGKWCSLDEAKSHALEGDVIYQVGQVLTRTAVLMKEKTR